MKVIVKYYITFLLSTYFFIGFSQNKNKTEIEDIKRKTIEEIELTTNNIEEKVEGIDELDNLVILVKDEESLRDGVMFLKARPAVKKVTIQRVSEFLRENSTKNSQPRVEHQPSFSGTNPNHDDCGMKV